MQDIIQLLPDSIANQIAAGEVVQRPASVVKELLENAIDARAKNVQLIVREAGKMLVQVIDDGMGMSEMDARMCFERHATSKIRKSEDLFSIRTLGFRGEALASIAAVAQVELRTRRHSDELGTLIRIEGSEIKTQEAVACLPGTNFCVKNLFYNVPARRNFLRSNAVEMRHILDEFQRVALAHPEVGMALYQNDQETYNLPAGKLLHRIMGMFGKNCREQLSPCSEETELVKVNGYIGKPEFSRKTRGEQFFFVNNRFVRHQYLHHAVISAYEGLLPEESYPFYALYIEMDPVHIDINVHPTKTEIKFDDERTVYAVVQAAVKRALSLHNLSPSIDFQTDANHWGLPYERKSPTPPAPSASSPTPATPKPSPESPVVDKSGREKSNQRNWAALYEDFQKKFPKEQIASVPDPAPNQLTFDSKINAAPAEKSTARQLRPEGEPATFQLHNRYIVTQVRSGMVVIDQGAAHERILYEKYLASLQQGNGVAQQMLFPQTLTLNGADFQLLIEIAGEIRNLGFAFDVTEGNVVVMRAVPAGVPAGDEKATLEGLIEQFKWHQAELNLGRKENIARSLARRSALKPGAKLSLPEMTTLIDQLFASSNPNYSPDGTPTLVMLTLEKIGSLFSK
jgi:DNA mismatch repair protein MutL